MILRPESLRDRMILPDDPFMSSRRGCAPGRRPLEFLLNPYRFGGGGGGTDPDFSSVVSLLHFDGSNGGTTFTDVKGNTFTPSGGAALSSAQAMFGATSALLDSSKYVESTASPGQRIVAGQFCVEMWVYLTSISGFRNVFSTRTDSGGGATLSLYVYFNGSQIQNSMSINSASGVLVANTWQHLAVTRDGSNNVRVFLNGSVVASGTNTINQSGSTNTRWRIGYDASTVGAALNGYMDDFRFTMGAARYTSAFTPPTGPFPNS